MVWTFTFRHFSMAFLMVAVLASRAMSRKLNEVTIVERHEQWIAHHGRIYKDEVEKAHRYRIFKENVELIEAFNNAGNRSYKLGINQFADLRNEEFRATRNGFKGQERKPTSYRYFNFNAAPNSIDWRAMGAVTGIKNQGQCRSCWAFSAVAAMEGLHKLRTGILTSLSEQELVDCDRASSDHGCYGGFMDNAFQFIIRNIGLTTETNYPYQGTSGNCNAKMARAATITGYEDVPENNEKALMIAVANQPVSSAIDSSSFEFQFYESGVFTGHCGTRLDHGITIVGYGTNADGTKYWLVKNSWGTGWGEGGFIRMKRDIYETEGLCGIAMYASFPTA